MDANERLRARVLKLLAMGVNQKVLAARMQIPPSTFNKWIHKQTDWRPDVNAPELLAKYEAEWAELVTGGSKETERAEPAAAGAGFPNRSTEPRKTGTD